MDFLLQSDSENQEFENIERMSELSKLNIFGLVLLSEVLCEHKINQNITDTLQNISLVK